MSISFLHSATPKPKYRRIGLGSSEVALAQERQKVEGAGAGTQVSGERTQDLRKIIFQPPLVGANGRSPLQYLAPVRKS